MSCEQEAFVKLRKQALEKPETASSVGVTKSRIFKALVY
jgi:hypothetical protein